MSGARNPQPIRIGLVAEEPIRLAGLSSIFDPVASRSNAQWMPVSGNLHDLLTKTALKFLVVDMHSVSGGLKTLEVIRQARPDIRSIVIGPAGNEELVLKSIIAGARAYLEANADPGSVCKAVQVVTEGSIWAPRRLLSMLIDRLLDAPETAVTAAEPRLTARERQVLELIMKARSNREIAHQLGIEERTVRAHLARLMRKAGVDNRIKLSMSVLSHSLIKKDSAARAAGAEHTRPALTKQ